MPRFCLAVTRKAADNRQLGLCANRLIPRMLATAYATLYRRAENINNISGR